MPTCQMCLKTFPNRVVIDGVPHTLCSRTMCLECSPWGKHNTRTSKAITNEQLGLYQCPQCRKGLPSEEFYWSEKGRRYSYCRSCKKSLDSCKNPDEGPSRHQQLKRWALTLMGGQCAVCGYSKAVSAMHFHHLVPGQKDFDITSFRKHPRNRVEAELKKCVLLCCRCHAEVHAGLDILSSGKST